MKKVLLLLVAIATLQFSASAQLPNGSIAPDFTATDLNGNVFNLYDALAEGKTVIMDVSAAWCGPCWNYHNSGVLEEMYAEFGPNGTCSDNVIVIFVEGETSNTLAQLEGTTTNNQVSGYSQGDWITGTPYPIFDIADDQFNTDYAIAYFPTIYRICPDGTVFESGQTNVAGHVAAIQDCNYENDAAISGAGGSFACSSDYTPVVNISNVNAGTLTSATILYSVDGGAEQSFNWTGSIAAGGNAEVSLANQTLSEGPHTIEYHLSDPNNALDANGSNNCASASFYVNTAAATAAPYAQNFSATSFPYSGWVLDNPDGDITWERNSANGGSAKMDFFNYGSAGQTDAMVLQPIDLTSISTPKLSFDVAYVPYSTSLYDGLGVMVSTDCGTTWTEVYYKENMELSTVAAPATAAFTPATNQWRSECVDLSAYSSNDKVFVAFVGYNGYGNNLYVDNINFSANCIVAVEELTGVIESLTLYPNPAEDRVTLNYNLVASENVVVELVDLLGNVVSVTNLGNQTPGNHQNEITLDNLASGVYMVNFKAGSSMSVSRLTVR